MIYDGYTGWMRRKGRMKCKLDTEMEEEYIRY
jgi:hypothetical protein